MRHDDFLDAFRRLGQRLTEPARLVLAGGSAMILLGYTDRDTGEGDAIEAAPKLSQIRRYIEDVAEDIGVAPDWLNDAVRAHRDVLPSDFHERLNRVAPHRALRIQLYLEQGSAPEADENDGR